MNEGLELEGRLLKQPNTLSGTTRRKTPGGRVWPSLWDAASHRWGWRRPWRCSEPAARWRYRLWRWRCSAAPWLHGYSSCLHRSSATHTIPKKETKKLFWKTEILDHRTNEKCDVQKSEACYVQYLEIYTFHFLPVHQWGHVFDMHPNFFIHFISFCVMSQQWNKSICMERPQEVSVAFCFSFFFKLFLWLISWRGGGKERGGGRNRADGGGGRGRGGGCVTLSNSSMRQTPRSASTRAPASSVHSLLTGCLWT